MFDMRVLDTLIAVVVIILVLSLVVQAIQAAIKKALKMKSKQIEDSLIDLFEEVLGQRTESKARNHLPFVRALPKVGSTRDITSKQVRDLYDETMNAFQRLGRISIAAKPALESLTKEDLKKVVATIGINTILPGAADKFKDACKAVGEVRALVDEIERTGLTGEAQLQWAKLQELVVPLLNDVSALTETGTFDQSLVQHVLGLRNLRLDSVLKIIGVLRAQIAKDAAAAPPASAEAGRLNTLLVHVDSLVKTLASIPRKFDAAVAPIRARVASIETWYDTVMQGFDERYSRSMRTWSIAIGFIVAVSFDASIFRVYHSIVADDVLRAQVVAKSQAIYDAATPRIRENQRVIEAATVKVQQAEVKKKQAEAKEEQATSSEAKAQAQAEKDAAKAEQARATEDEVRAKETVQAIGKKLSADIADASATYSGLGFRPKLPDWSGRSGWYVLSDLLGFLLMALLLSLGAPFWHDALASLFGVKSLLEKKTQTRNVEQQSGEGSTLTA